MTLNFQYFASYPKDLQAAQEKLSQILSEPSSPDVICVQQGLAGRDVLCESGFKLCVCAARCGFAQSVCDMVYGDVPRLKACDPQIHNELLCNQIYIRAKSDWAILDQGATKTS